MRKLIISLLALIGILGGFSAAQAVTFDGTDYSPQYTTGITDVYMVTEAGVPAYVPVWSMEACEHEDGYGQVACVWYAPSRADGMGQSFAKLSGDQFAYISNEAAGILLVQGTLPMVDYSAQPVLTEPVQTTPTEAVTAPTATEFVEGPVDTGNYTYPLCQHEDGSGQSGDCIWVSSVQGMKNGEFSMMYWGDEDDRHSAQIDNETAEMLTGY